MEGGLAELNAIFAENPAQPDSFFDRVVDEALSRPDEAHLSPELALAVLSRASPEELYAEEGWGCTWMDMAVWLPADSQPGGSWRIRGARAAAGRGAGAPGGSFGEAFAACPQTAPAWASGTQDSLPTWTGNFLCPWAPRGLPHLEDFAAPEEQAEFLSLIPRDRLVASLAAWEAEAPLDALIAGEQGLCVATVARRRRVLLAAARAALA